MNPVMCSNKDKQYWFFGRHVTERLNCMRKLDADCASREIMKILSDIPNNEGVS